MEHEGDGDTNYNSYTRDNPQRLEELEIGGWNETIQIVKLSQDTEKSSEDLRRLAVIQTTVKDHLANAGVKKLANNCWIEWVSILLCWAATIAD